MKTEAKQALRLHTVLRRLPAAITPWLRRARGDATRCFDRRSKVGVVVGRAEVRPHVRTVGGVQRRRVACAVTGNCDRVVCRRVRLIFPYHNSQLRHEGV